MSFDLKIKDGNIVIGSNGDVEKVENTEKLIQDILKIAITPMNSNKFHPAYGSLVSKTLIGNILPAGFLVDSATSQLQNCITTLQKQQQEQMKFQAVSGAEQIAAIKQIKIERNQTDPRYFQVLISVLSRDFSITTTGFNITP
jgi:hypothetical protein